MDDETLSRFRRDFGALFTAHGFKARNRRWYRSGDDVIVVVDLQKSQFGDYFAVNFGVNLGEAGDLGFPTTSNAHLGWTIELFLGVPINSYHDLLSFDSGMDYQDRLDGLRVLVNRNVMPLVDKVSKSGFFHSPAAEDLLSRASILRRVRPVLALPDL